MIKILIVDDDPVICALLEAYLVEKGYQTFIALSGKAAIEKVKTEKPQIVLLDIGMPGMDGVETLRQIKNIDKEIGVVMISGLKDEETAKMTLKLGADDYITKPMDLKYLDDVLLVKITMMAQ